MEEVLDECLVFLKKTYIPTAAGAGFLMNPRMCRVMLSDSEEGESYSIQFNVKNTDTLNYWMEHEGSALNHALVSRFGEKVVGFSTLLEEIDWEND